MMKKILFMLTSMDIGGVEKSLLSLLYIIPKEEYEITILLLNKKGEFLKYIPEWVRVEEVDWYQGIKPKIMESPQKVILDFYEQSNYKKMISFGFYYYLSKKIKSRYLFYQHVFKGIPQNPNVYDIAISYQAPTDIIDFYIANKVTAVKKISWVHFDVSKHQINQKLYQKLHKKFDKIAIVSEEAKRKLIEIIPSDTEKSEVFLNVVSSKVIKEMALKDVSFDDNYNGIKIVTVGRLSKEKGQDIGIRVLRKLLEGGLQHKMVLHWRWKGSKRI